jgi:hypothetical protein
MRALFGILAIGLGTISFLLAGRYGWKGADTAVDGMISAVVFGSIALCAFLFDAAAVRLWFMKHRLGAAAIGLIAAAALVVTFTNSLGAIAARGDVTLAERTKATESRQDDRAELKRLQASLAALGRFTPADSAAVAAARRAADAATTSKERECGGGDPKQRGRFCRERETDEQKAADALAKATAAKALTDMAARIEGDIAAVRARLGEAPAVQNANPLGAALEAILGIGGGVLTAWQQAIVAGVFELCLVGVMVIYELLGHGKAPVPQAAGGRPVGAREPQVAATAESTVVMAAPPAKKTANGRRPAKRDNIGDFVQERFFPAEGAQRTEMKTMLAAYRAWCADKGLAPVALEDFLNRIEKLCGKIGVEIEVGEDQRVYLLNVRLDQAAGAAVATTH